MQTELWQRIHAYSPDKAGVEFPFSMRLAREQGWSKRFSLRVIEEYRRFIYLACTAGHPVTPSPAIDAAWHLHLIYSKYYWDDFCRDVLQRPLHHHPTEGGVAEGDKFTDWYSSTLKSYEAFFGQKPPEDIWPDVAKRFVRRREQWVDLDENWVIPIPGWLKKWI